MDKISIIVPCYNQAKYLDECLNSIQKQTYSNWECLIIDDGSTDESYIIAKKWLEKDGRFQYFYKENSGVCETRNLGIEKASAQWILPLDADDKIDKNYLSEAQKYFAEDIAVIYTGGFFFGSEKRSWDLPKYDFELLLKKSIIPSSGFFQKKRCNFHRRF